MVHAISLFEKLCKIPYRDQNSLVTSGLKELSSWSLVKVSFLAWEVQKPYLEYTKTNQCSAISHFKFCYAWTELGKEKYVALQFFKKFISSGTKDINLTSCQNWGWVLF